MKNELLDLIKKHYPQDTTDQILDWYEATTKFKMQENVAGYTAWRRPALELCY